LKAWLTTRATAYTPQARAYGLPAPKGVLTVGVPGCGKSLTAKAVATAWGIPLLRVDLGALKSKFVGESESNLRRAFDVIGAIGRCVVWFDEIEKALAGATQGAADGGVSSDALGAILSWMQDRQGEAFVFATANDVEALPPELLRKGRFDEVFFVDTPTATERIAVLHAALRAHGCDAAPIGATAVAEACEGFTGAEVAAIVPDAMFAAFNDGARPITGTDLLTAAGSVVPLTKTAGEKIERLRAWAKTRARPASKPETATPAAATVRALDVA
jgi:SpoVK/Ycf46/Vps4 family AAA+-type ATPase